MIDVQFFIVCSIAANFVVCSHDWVGHGRSEGERGKVDHFSAPLRDFENFVRGESAQHPVCSLVKGRKRKKK